MNTDDFRKQIKQNTFETKTTWFDELDIEELKHQDIGLLAAYLAGRVLEELI